MMQDSVMEWLLENNDPSVRFLTLTSLLDKSSEDNDVIKAKKSIMDEGLVPKILASQEEGGYWGDAERFYRDKYKGTVWILLLLAELSADPENTNIKNACEFILRCSREPVNGGFSYDQSKKTNFGLPSGVIPCLTGNMVYSLIKLGYLNDERIQKSIEWIVKYQRADDGEGTAPTGEPYDRYFMCWGKHTCHMGAAKSLKALAAIPAHNRSMEVNLKIEELAEYFLKHHIYKKSHNLEEVSRPGWLKFGFPLMYQTDVLELAEIFAELKINDGRLDEAIEVIRKKQNEDGKWKMDNSFNGKMITNVEDKGKMSKWITLKSLKVLKTYDKKVNHNKLNCGTF